MKPFNKEEYNKLCAELLGLHRSDKVAIYKMTAYPYDFLRFDFDWNWIMEVVEKIESLGFMFNIFQQDALIEKDNKFIVVTHAIKVKTKKEAVVQAIWEFLQWYNNQKS